MTLAKPICVIPIERITKAISSEFATVTRDQPPTCMPLRRPGHREPADRGGLFELEPLERKQAIRFRDESSGLSNTLRRERDKLAHFESHLSSRDRTLSRKIGVTDVRY